MCRKSGPEAAAAAAEVWRREETEEGRGGKGNEVTKERMGEGVKREIASKFQLLVLTTADHE